jgi:PGF-CTERM protein
MIDKDNRDGPRGARTGMLIAALMVAALVPLAASVVGHGDATQVRLEASEDCPDATYCYEVTEGSMDDLAAGEEVHFTFVNPESNDLNHNVYVADLADASDDRDTDPSAAEDNTRNLAPGEETSLEFFVPNGFSGVYVWCDVGVHESQGMYLETAFSEDATTDSGDGQETSDSPGLGALAALAALGAVAVGLHRRET